MDEKIEPAREAAPTMSYSQNKPNLLGVKMNGNTYATREYRNHGLRQVPENKANLTQSLGVVCHSCEGRNPSSSTILDSASSAE